MLPYQLFDAIFSMSGLLVVEIQVLCRFIRLIFSSFSFFYDVFIKIHEIETQLMLISDFRVIIVCHSIHFILLSASLVC